MSVEVKLRCKCGQIEGILRPAGRKRRSSTTSHLLRPSNHMVCMCDDCQSYAQYLGSDTILDAHGGTEVVQLMPSQITLTCGQQHLSCVRLSERGLYRWYAGCCKTPIANTLGAKGAFAGVVHTFYEHLSEEERERLFGPMVERVQGRYGHGELPPGSHQRASLGLILRMSFNLLGWLIRGGAQPSAFFSVEGSPATTPVVLTPEERAVCLASARG